MAGVKISQLQDGGALQSTDAFPVARGSFTRKIAGSELLTPANFNVADSPTIDLTWNSSTRTLSADVSTAVTSFNVVDSPTIDLTWNSSTRTLSAEVIPSYFNYFPLFPEVNTTDNKLLVTSTTGNVVIATGQTFSWRGLNLINTDSFDISNRSFSTTASKTYHLRWYAPGTANAPSVTYPNGRFLLQDLSSGTYNPTSASETASIFDTTYDSMLVARVVTNSSNIPTVTLLINKARLLENLEFRYATSTVMGNLTFGNGANYTIVGAGSTAGQRVGISGGVRLHTTLSDYNLDWSRTPQGKWSGGFLIAGGPVVDDTVFPHIDGLTLTDGSGSITIKHNRYQLRPAGWSDWNSDSNTLWNFGLILYGTFTS